MSYRKVTYIRAEQKRSKTGLVPWQVEWSSEEKNQAWEKQESCFQIIFGV